MKQVTIPTLILTALVSTEVAAQTYQQLAKTDDSYQVARATGTADYAWTQCEVINFLPTTRGVTFAGLESAHNREAFAIPACRWELGFLGDYRRIMGAMSTNTLEDLGTYTIRCFDRHASQQDTNRSCVRDPNCGRDICPARPNTTVYEPEYTFTIEVYNNPPTLSLSHSGTGIVSGRDVVYNANIDLQAAASDSDPGTVNVTWVVTPPRPGTTANIGSVMNRTLNVSFRGEADFGTWRFVAHADDAQGERVSRDYSITVVNQTPVPVISGPTRVRVHDAIALAVSPDEDGGTYSNISWRRRPQGSVGWDPIATTEALSIPTTATDIEFWEFEVTVTDNEPMPLSGTSSIYTVEVYNDPPTISLVPITAPVPAAGGIINLVANTNDPDGGPVEVRWRAVQAPAAAGVPVGVELSSMPNFSFPVTPAHAGTWVFRAVATDDEGASVQSDPLTVVVDAPPQVVIRDEPSTVVGPGTFYLTDESIDPDSHCANPADPNRCHLVEPDASFTALSPGVTSWRWYVESVPTEQAPYIPLDRVSVAFSGVPDSLQSIPFLEGTIPQGTYRFRVDVTDGEGNSASGTITVEVLPSPVPPVAWTSLPQQYETDSGQALTTDILVDGSLSFDPDTARSFSPGPGEGITAWSWTALPPTGCTLAPTVSATPIAVVLPAGTVIPLDCYGVWAVRLAVGDDDTPQEFGVADAIVVIRRCAADVCLDQPTAMYPAEVGSGSPASVPIHYYVDPLVYLRPTYVWGFYAFIDIIPTGSTTPIMTLMDATVSSRPGQLTTVHWAGETLAGGLAPSGTYDVRVRLQDILLAPGPQVRENFAILFEEAEIRVDPSTSQRYVRWQSLEDGGGTVDLGYNAAGTFGIDTVRLAITRGGALANEQTISTTSLTGVLSWDGRQASGSMLPPGHYEATVSAYRDGRRLDQSPPFAFTVYRLGLGPDPVAILPVSRNLDDDDGDGVRDQEDSVVSGEDDLVALDIRIEPPINGEISVTTVSGGTPLSLYLSSDKNLPLGDPATYTQVSYLPIPNFWVQGEQAGLHDLEFTFSPTDGTPWVPERAQVAVRGVELVADNDGNLGYHATDTAAAAVIPGLWQDAHQAPTASAPAVVRNTVGNDFIDRDPAHFYVRVTDATANHDPTVEDTLFVNVGTVEQFPLPAGESEVFVDAVQEVPAYETGVDTGIFVTQSQLITSNDEDMVEGDDELVTLDNTTTADFYNFDDLRGDRTHRIGTRAHGFLAGGVRVNYGTENVTVPVCGRSPDARHSIEMRVVAFLEPYEDTGIVEANGTVRPGSNTLGTFDFVNSNTTTDIGGVPVHDPEELSEPFLDISTGSIRYFSGSPTVAAVGLSGRGAVVTEEIVSDQIYRANGAWAPACLEVRKPNPLEIMSAPLDINGIDILQDATVNTIMPSEAAPIYIALNARAPLNPQQLDVVYGGLLSIGLREGMPTGAHGITFLRANPTIVLMNAHQPNNRRTLAHELGHALARMNDSEQPPWNFFPAMTARLDDSFQFRRMPNQVITAARTPRTVTGTTAVGNPHLQAY